MQINKIQINTNPSFKANLYRASDLSPGVKELVPGLKANIQKGIVDAFIQEYTADKSKIIRLGLYGDVSFTESFRLPLSDATVEKLSEEYFKLQSGLKQFLINSYGEKVEKQFEQTFKDLNGYWQAFNSKFIL